MSEITITVPEDQEALEAELREKLSQGVVYFLYKKKSTEQLRIARGTTNPELFSYTYKTDKRKNYPGYITYWDIDKDAWRMLLTKNIIKIVSND